MVWVSLQKKMKCSLFHIDNITPLGENHRLFRVKLTLTNDSDKDLRRLTDRIREETFPDNEGWYRLGLVLLDMGHPEKAQWVYEILLRQETEESAKAPIYGQLELVKDQQGEYQEAVRFYGKALAIRQQSLLPIIPIWLFLSTISVCCTITWVTIRKHVHIMNVLRKSFVYAKVSRETR
jgi:tetratricopeptide (TPR) repeat protein